MTRTTQTIYVTLAILLSTSFFAWAVPALYNSLFQPIEWYNQPSAFFRTATNPGKVIPVMASDGYRLPVDATIGGSSGSGGIPMIGTFALRLPAVNIVYGESDTLVATNSVTSLQNIASWVSGAMIVWQPRGKMYYMLYNVGSPTPTVASLTRSGRVMEGGDPERIFHLRTSMDAAFVSDATGGIATLTYGNYLEN